MGRRLVPPAGPLAGGHPMRTQLVAFLLVLAGAGTAGVAQPAKREKADFEKAVDKALLFLHTERRSEGAWPSADDNTSVSATSLAVMAFLSAGHVPGEGRYGKTIEDGVRAVLKHQQPNGLIASRGGHFQMYHHGMATLMLAEVGGMTTGKLNKDVRKALEKAVGVILKAQRTSGGYKGGWRYQIEHAGGSDMSVTGWQLLALRAAKNLGCDVPAETIERALGYVKRSHHPSGGFTYEAVGRRSVTLPCTGTGVLALELCGGKKEHHSPMVLKGAGYLVRRENLDALDNMNGYYFYSIYYGSQATFQVGGSYWSAYRDRLHKALLRHQRADGSWQGGGENGWGPNYCTALAVLALTVEYRYLPIYQRGKDSAAEKK
jgi:squalene cyclase